MRGARRWVPPRRALALATMVVGVVLVIGAGAWWLGGRGAAMASVLGAVSVIALALRRPTWSHLWWFSVVLAGGGTGAVWTGSALAVGVLVAVSVLGVAPIALRYGPVVAIVPVVIAGLAMGADGIEPAAAVAGVFFGVLACAAALRTLPIPTVTATPLSRSLIVAYLAVLALLSGLTTATVIALEMPHGLWIVIALAMVLAPQSHETMPRARARIVGTVAGAAGGAVAATLLPLTALLVAGGAALLISVALAFAGRQSEFIAFMAFSVVALVSAGGVETAWAAGLSRVWLTALGTAVAIAAGLLLARREAVAWQED
ncbi:FUSC family protein [Demequina aestuarii]|uniref:FUSC family protein n=1 Tax=Demequina aestuarii TaxID=327095 RepID=UPI00187C6538|nr:FUSC family protein [Demequina aestuarii]